MAQVMLDLTQRNRLVVLLAERVGLTRLQRETMLDEAGLAAFRTALTFDVEAAIFAAQLVRELQARGTLEETGQPALVSLLRWLRDEVAGHAPERAFVDDLLLPYQKVGDPTRPLKLFVSYRRRSWGHTQLLASELHRRLNAEIFVDYRGVDATDFERSILGHLRASDGVLLIVSEHTFSERIHEPGDWVRREIELALSLGKPIVLVGVDGLLPPPADKLPPSLRAITRMQSINFYPDYWEHAVERVADFLAKVTTAEASPRAAPPPPPLSTEPAPAEPPPPAPPSPWEMLREAQERLEADDFDRGIFLLEALRDMGFKPRFLDLATFLTDALRHREAAQREQQAREEYEEIALLARSRFTLAQARAAWVIFREAYPDYTDDPAGLAEKLKAPTPKAPPPQKAPAPTAVPAPPVARPTAEQQALLDVMLDPKRPPPERGEAGRKLAAIGDPRPGVGLRSDGLPDIAWVRLEGGEFPIGGDEGAQAPLTSRTVKLGAFSMAKYPVTNAQWAAFLKATDGYENERWWREAGVPKQEPAKPRWSEGNHPRENVNWYEATAFCRWLSAKLGYEVRLPTEEEWERAARGKEGRIYPWGLKYMSGHANIDETSTLFGNEKVGPHDLGRTSAVGIYPQGATPEGICDLAGNVWEWTGSLWNMGEVDITSARVLRGGSWVFDSLFARAGSRFWWLPDNRFISWGFRLVGPAVVALDL